MNTRIANFRPDCNICIVRELDKILDIRVFLDWMTNDIISADDFEDGMNVLIDLRAVKKIKNMEYNVLYTEALRFGTTHNAYYGVGRRSFLVSSAVVHGGASMWVKLLDIDTISRICEDPGKALQWLGVEDLSVLDF